MTASATAHNCEKSAPFGFLMSGYRQDGERWTCPACNRVWVHVCDEAEGCCWEPAPSPRQRAVQPSAPQAGSEKGKR